MVGLCVPFPARGGCFGVGRSETFQTLSLSIEIRKKKQPTKKHDRNHPGSPDENDAPSSNLLVVLSWCWCWCCWRHENGKPAVPANI